LPEGYGTELVRQDIGVIQHHFHSRDRVYPQDVQLTVPLASVAVADTFGAWVEIIPLNTVPFPFMIVGIVIEAASAAATYFIQIGYNIINADPGVNMELGERRTYLPTPIVRATELLTLQAQNVPANSRIMGRLKTDTGAIDTADISVVVTRHLNVSVQMPLWPAFPW